MNFYVTGYNWFAKVDIDTKKIDKSDWYNEACTRAIESILDQEEKEDHPKLSICVLSKRLKMLL